MAGMGPRILSLVLLGSLCATAHAQLTIAGSIYEDPPALALRQHFTPLAGVALRLYRDGGDRVPGADDAAAGMATTDPKGVYGFRVSQPGDYWVVVDSRTIAPAQAWAEQTFGPSGALCARPDGVAQATYFEGPCFGGRTAASDDASALATSEHVAGVTLRGSATDVDFAFSFDAVTSLRDGERVQGSLRQFLVNANAIDGPNRMRFVPLQRAPEQRETTMGVPPRWWSLMLAAALPELTDDETVIDGTAWSFLSPASVANVNPGRLGERPTFRPGERETQRQERPELEVVVTAASGIVCNVPCAIRSLALHGPRTPIHVRGDARIEHVMIGAAPDGSMVAGGEMGLRIEKGTTIARDLLVTSQSAAGIYVEGGARLDAERLEVSRCGTALTGGGIVLLSDGSSIRSSLIAGNPGVGVVLGATDGTRPASLNTVDGCTISSNQAGVLISPGSTRNVITRNDIMWNRLGGVTVAPFTAGPPRENRVSANRFDENGLRPIVLDITDTPRETSCTRTNLAPNAGIGAPRIEHVRVQDQRVIIRGRACPGEVVELYQSYLTSGTGEGESLNPEGRARAIASVGEFNYLGTVDTTAEGTFEAAFPFPALTISDRARLGVDPETDVWARDVMRSAKPEERAFSAIAIDAAGNTSEMSPRRRVD